MKRAPYPGIGLLIVFKFGVHICFGLDTSLDGQRYLASVRRFADAVLLHGRDTYGNRDTPLFVDGLQGRTLEPAIWQGPDRPWILCNVASQQPLFRLLDGLTALTGETQYRQAADAAAKYALEHLQSRSGLLHWGGHNAWDLDSDQPVGQGKNVHELKGHQPYYRLMWRVNANATRKLMEGIWAGHILDWSSLDYNRHAYTAKAVNPPWNHAFQETIEVPFPTDGGNLSFVNVIPPLLHAGVMLATLDNNTNALTWTRRLIYRWQQGRHPQTGLCGGQLSYRKQDRAQQALGHVHPDINEAKIVASYHQTCRYHHLPLAQMQAALTLIEADGAHAQVGREFIAWASADLKCYARHCYDSDQGQFVAVMIDGTPLRWQEARTGYYVPASFAPRKPDGFILWGYSLAYRLTRDEVHWQMARQLAKRLDLGDIGKPTDSRRKLKLDTNQNNWRMIYALLELHQATKDPAFLLLGCRIADNLLPTQSKTGLFPRPGREYARTGDEVSLAILHLAAALQGKSSLLPQPVFDSRFFHCEYFGPLEKHQEKRADKRTYDHLVFYGE